MDGLLTVYLDYTPDQEALQADVRSTMEALMTDALRAELTNGVDGGPEYRSALKQLGAAGWLGLGWPTEHGGQGRSPMDEFIFYDEVHRSGFPIPLLTLNTVGPSLIHYGTPEQQATYLPQILAGDCHFSIGYTEPSAGTDLASLTTHATRDGDEYVISGQKTFISLAGFADHIWMAVRTDPDAAPHKGISVLIVPADSPGLSLTPIHNLGGHDLHALYLDEVRVPVGNRVGPEHGGWRIITTQLNHERIALTMVGPLARFCEEARAWAADQPTGDGGVALDLHWVQQHLAVLEAKVEVLRLMNWRQAWMMKNNTLRMEDASALKVYGSELNVEAYRMLLDLVGATGTLKAGSPGVALEGALERYYRSTLVLTFGGGTNEVQREIIAAAGLKIPRAER